MVVPLVWGGGVSLSLPADPAAGAVVPATEQALTVRPFAGWWALLVAGVWFCLAYRSRDIAAWESGLVLIGSAVALVRLGNAWLFALVLVPVLSRQLHVLRFGRAPRLLVLIGLMVVFGIVLQHERTDPTAQATVTSTKPSSFAVRPPGGGRVG